MKTNENQLSQAIDLISKHFEIKSVIFHRNDDKKIHGCAKAAIHWKNGREVSLINFDFDKMKVLELESIWSEE